MESKYHKHLRWCINSGSLLIWELSMAALSHLTSMFWVDCSGPQIVAGIVMGTSFLTKMWAFFKFSAHSSWNHLSQKNAPHVWLLEASDTSVLWDSSFFFFFWDKSYSTAMKSESTTLCLSELIGSKEQSNLIWTLWLINQGDSAEIPPWSYYLTHMGEQTWST